MQGLDRVLAYLTAVCLWFANSAARTETLRSTDSDTGTPHWQTQGTAFSLEVIQLLPDYVRAVYAGRGLPPSLVEEIAGYCVFGSIARNASDHPLTYDLRDWRAVTPDGAQHALKDKDAWLAEWRRQGVGFGWTLQPTAQTFEVGDWGQGFLTVKLPRGARFDLLMVWRQDGHERSARLEGLECARDAMPG